MWPAVLLLAAAIIYVIFPGDFDFVPFFGRLDDLLFVMLALYYYRKRKRAMGGFGGFSGQQAESSRERGSPPPKEEEGDPYLLLGVDGSDDEEEIKGAYRELLGKYHPDRVQHLGEEFREMAAEKAKAINLAWERIRKERKFS